MPCRTGIMKSMPYLFILFMTTLLFSLSACGDTQTWTQEETLPATGVQNLNIELDSGDLTVQSHPEATIQVKSEFEAPSKHNFKEGTHLRLISAAKSVGVRIEHPELQSPEKFHANLKVSIPSTLALEIKANNGNVTITDMQSPLSIQSNNGNLKLQKIAGDVQIKSDNGNLELQDVSGSKHQLETQNGNILLQNLNGAVSAHSGNGSIEAHLKGVSRPENYLFETLNGSVKLFLPGDSSARIRYHKGLGNVQTDFKQLKDSAQILVGEGTARIQIKSSNGNIEVRKD